MTLEPGLSNSRQSFHRTRREKIPKAVRQPKDLKLSFQHNCDKFVHIRGLSHVVCHIWLFVSSNETDACGRRTWATGVLLVLGQPCMRWCFDGILASDHIGKNWCIQNFGDIILKQGLVEDKKQDGKPPSYRSKYKWTWRKEVSVSSPMS